MPVRHLCFPFQMLPGLIGRGGEGHRWMPRSHYLLLVSFLPTLEGTGFWALPLAQPQEEPTPPELEHLRTDGSHSWNDRAKTRPTLLLGPETPERAGKPGGRRWARAQRGAKGGLAPSSSLGQGTALASSPIRGGESGTGVRCRIPAACHAFSLSTDLMSPCERWSLLLRLGCCHQPNRPRAADER